AVGRSVIDHYVAERWSHALHRVVCQLHHGDAARRAEGRDRVVEMTVLAENTSDHDALRAGLVRCFSRVDGYRVATLIGSHVDERDRLEARCRGRTVMLHRDARGRPEKGFVGFGWRQ